jgi:hypothetical protein
MKPQERNLQLLNIRPMKLKQIKGYFIGSKDTFHLQHEHTHLMKENFEWCVWVCGHTIKQKVFNIKVFKGDYELEPFFLAYNRECKKPFWDKNCNCIGWLNVSSCTNTLKK